MDSADPERTRILIVSDSRGYELGKKINHGLTLKGPGITFQLDFIHKGGLTIEKLPKLLDQEIETGSDLYDYLYVFCGVNNLSEKHESGRVTAVYDDIGHLVDNMYDRLFCVRNYLFKFSYRPVICQMMGLSLDKYNRTSEDQIFGQKIINQAIPILNRAINSINTDVECISPWLGATIHSIIHKKYSHKYLRLRDGLHPTEDTIQIWADNFVEAILKNYSWKD